MRSYVRQISSYTFKIYIKGKKKKNLWKSTSTDLWCSWSTNCWRSGQCLRMFALFSDYFLGMLFGNRQTQNNALGQSFIWSRMAFLWNMRALVLIRYSTDFDMSNKTGPLYGKLPVLTPTSPNLLVHPGRAVLSTSFTAITLLQALSAASFLSDSHLEKFQQSVFPSRSITIKHVIGKLFDITELLRVLLEWTSRSFFYIFHLPSCSFSCLL